jgi:glyoxylate carboligase
MQVLIHVEVKDSLVGKYKNPIIEWTKKELPRVVTFDFDNLSESSICGYAEDLLKQAKQAFVIIDVNKSKNISLVTKFINSLTRQKDKPILLVVNGQNATLSKMGKILGAEKFLQNLKDNEQQRAIKEFFHG